MKYTATINKLENDFSESDFLSKNFDKRKDAISYLNDSDNEPAFDCIGYTKWINEQLIELYLFGEGTFKDFTSAKNAFYNNKS